MESFFSGMGLGWTMSKLLPYVVFILLGIIMTVMARKYFKKKFLRVTSLVFIVVPVGIYFAISPIYESDFSNNYTSQESLIEICADGRLTVIAIPNCPYCDEAMDRLLKIQEHTSSKSIDFKVLTSDSLMLEPYLAKANGNVNVSAETEFEAYEKVATGRFPTYVFTSGKETRIWHNDGIGTSAFDWLEDQLTAK